MSIYNENTTLRTTWNFAEDNLLTALTKAEGKSQILKDTKLLITSKLENQNFNYTFNKDGNSNGKQNLAINWYLKNSEKKDDDWKVTFRYNKSSIKGLNLPTGKNIKGYKIVIYGTENKNNSDIPHKNQPSIFGPGQERDKTWQSNKNLLCTLESDKENQICEVPAYKLYHSRFEVRKNPETWFTKNLIWQMDEVEGLHGVDLLFSLE